MKDKHKKFKNRGNAGNWIGVGAAIGWRKPKDKNEGGKHG